MNSADSVRWILVTGANRGIGYACAVALARAGFGVVAHCRRDRVQLERLCSDIAAHGGRVRPVVFDVTDRGACARALEVDLAENGPYYGVVSNAGVTRDGVFPGMRGEDWDTVLHTNLDGFFNVVRPVIMSMIRARRGGRIVALSSAAGQIGNRGQVNYSASKAGLIGAVKALALELAGRSITVNAVAPGLIDSDMTATVRGAELVKLIPAGRIGRAEEVAQLVAYLCSDAAGYITRQVVAINGGLC
ncbi:MAG TPA: 3-oxoacyl-ACP reductase FabG [Nevskiaceae bacterium]|nr:3-oxoacyl-ACP reductase FabG [Nevskiaceae bacterium]